MSRVLERFGVAALFGISVVAPALARQHLVEAGSEWSHIAGETRPGDEIILMPGRHRAASLSGLNGTAERPIVIRSLKADAVALIAGGRYGLELHNPLYVTLQDLTISGAMIAGILVDDGEEHAAPAAPNAENGAAAPAGAPAGAQEVEGEPVLERRAGSLLFRRVSVLRTGPEGDRDAVRMCGVVEARFESCTFEGWGGAAIELLACRDVTIENCSLRGLANHGQVSGVQIRAGSRGVRVTGCRFERSGFYGVVAGGVSALAEFRPPLAPAPVEPASEVATPVQRVPAPAPAQSAPPPVATPQPAAPVPPPPPPPAPRTDAAPESKLAPNETGRMTADPAANPPGKPAERPRYSSKPRSAVKGAPKRAPAPIPAPVNPEPPANQAPASVSPAAAPAPAAVKAARNYGTLVEASDVEISRNVIIDSPMPFAAIHAEQCLIRNNTILRPQQGLLAFAAPQTDLRFARAGHVLFEANVIVGDISSLPVFAVVQEPAETSLFQLGQNLWWSPNGSEAAQAALANLVGRLPSQTPSPQVLNVDPILNEQLRPTNPEAKLFGPEAP